MSQTVQSVRTPMHPLVVLAVAVVLPGVGQVLNGSPSRGLSPNRLNRPGWRPSPP